MYRRLTVVVALAAAAVPAQAQNGPIAGACPVTPLPPSQGFPDPLFSGLLIQDACQKAADLSLFLAPQFGALVAGGNPDPGQGGTVGGIGRFGASVRVNALRGPIPQFDNVPLSVLGAQRSTLRTTNATLAFPEADLAIGLFRGVPAGVTSVGGVDLLLNAAYVPSGTRDNVAVRTRGGSVRVGYGVRVGLLQESPFVPGVSVAVLRRQTPTAEIDAATGNDTVGVRGLRVTSDSWRLTAAKGLVFVRVAAGVGQDRVDARASLDAVVNEAGVRVSAAGPRFAYAFTRTNYFANLTLGRLPFAALVAELGRTSGGGLPATYNSFEGRRPDAAYTYGSVALRVGR